MQVGGYSAELGRLDDGSDDTWLRSEGELRAVREKLGKAAVPGDHAFSRTTYTDFGRETTMRHLPSWHLLSWIQTARKSEAFFFRH